MVLDILIAKTLIWILLKAQESGGRCTLEVLHYGMTHYERVANIIRHIDQHFNDQPNLEMLAKRMRLSPYHFHRLFSAWAGITPKDFVQCLTLTQVKQKLREGKSVLETTFEAGLSSPGRLHDLCVQLVAASPGEIKSGGKDLTITTGMTDSPFGPCLIAVSERGICHLSFASSKKINFLKKIRQEWPRAQVKRDNAYITKLGRQIFYSGKLKRARPPLRAFIKGTKFQISVWRALLKIPQGTLTTYGSIAQIIKNPKAVRAVGTAVGENPVAYLIPCHRVIRGTGAIGQYRGGQVRKKALLAWEFTRQPLP